MPPSPAITYRPLDALSDFDRAFALERRIWAMSDADPVPVSVMVSIVGNGGVMMGAEADGKLVGVALGIPARRDGEPPYLWSYMAGIAPEYQRMGIGYGIKHAQREWALAQDYHVMRWTFDPLQRQNANFNFNRLGVTANRYYVNRYGTLNDGINAGLESDRLEVAWRLDALNITPPPIHTAPFFRVLSQENGALIRNDAAAAQGLEIEIPYTLASLKQTQPALVLAWQRALRDVMESAFSAGFIATQFVIDADAERCFYRLALESR